MSDQLEVPSHKPEFWDEASKQLMRRDRILRKIIPVYQGDSLKPPFPPFMTLARAIISQQVSTKAADTIWGRFTGLYGRRPSPAAVMKHDLEALRGVGLSRRKAEYVSDLATCFAERKVRPAAWSGMNDEEVIASLCSIRGVGRWTAEMFLIFNLQRPDVLPLDDAGLIKAISLHYFSGEPVSRFEAREVAQAWAPWRTVATWYMWRSLDSGAQSH